VSGVTARYGIEAARVPSSRSADASSLKGVHREADVHPMRRVLFLVPLTAVVLLVGACGPLPSAAPGQGVAAEPWVADMLGVVNARRAEAGVAPLALCGTLQAAARGHSADQAASNRMSHTGSGGSNMQQRAEGAGYVGWSGLAENVAAGYGDVGSVMAGWMGSDGHRRNLLSANYEHVGFGLANGADGTPYWTQDFGRSGTC
jgi:uncharacterized protein YkwD